MLTCSLFLSQEYIDSRKKYTPLAMCDGVPTTSVNAGGHFFPIFAHSLHPYYRDIGPASEDISCLRTDGTRLGIELSLCSATCLSGIIYTSSWPDLCIGLLGGTLAPAPLSSVGWPPVRSSSDLAGDQTTPLPGELVYKFASDVANRRLTEAHG
ncbi:hypothetical protein THAOC_15054 [Thalassiosira oceanica]|uniref:Uncharacterized protein n=1 Tax=Thalassiosira oceanica TaxID=159749 RepID=K0SGZ8_THAOC|nr:hypothetical protein THAOC_15054 [Thalassiosira oceanica]|eukprot:EJK64234.1 hypothetical protein THAOC_15054 [Thalassiosira oceanica]